VVDAFFGILHGEGMRRALQTRNASCQVPRNGTSAIIAGTLGDVYS
jgi:hypothetical protein